MRQDVYKRHIKNEKNHWWFTARREIIYYLISNLKQKNPISILDFGAGSGTNVEILTKLGNVDIFETNQKMKSFLKSKFQKYNNVKIINKVQKKYNLIVAADVIEHIKDDKKVIKKFHNFLKINGHLLVTVPAFNFLFSNKDVALKHFRRYEKLNLENLLNKKFQIKKLSYFNFFLFIPLALSIFILKFKKKKFIKFAETTPFCLLNLILKNIFSIEKYFLKFFNFPFGISIIALAKKNV